MNDEQPIPLARISWQDPKTGQHKELVLMEGATVSIGRSDSNDICIPERHVSRRHAVINYRDGIFMFADLGSANGVFVNDQKLTEPFPLASGDVIRLFVPELFFTAIVSEEERETVSQGGTLIVPASAEGCPYLEVTSGPQEGADFPLTADSLTIGRATTNAAWDLSLQDRAVSRPHACLEHDPATDEWRIIDLGSANGTLVNGRPITGDEGHVLRDGDVLTLGETLLLFRRNC